MLTQDTRAALADLQALHQEHKDEAFKHTEGRRADLLAAIQAARDAALEDLFGDAEGSGLCADIPARVREYAYRTDWSLLDLVALASCAEPSDDSRIATRLAPRAVVYQALRMLDDVVDDHDTYKGEIVTLLGELRQVPGRAPLAMAANLLPLAIMLLEFDVDDVDRASARRTVTGMLSEFTCDEWTLARYERMVDLKMVSYGMLLYQPVLRFFDADVQPELESFLRRSFAVAQLANDLHDTTDDRVRGQPNFWNLAPFAGQGGDIFLSALRDLAEQGHGLGPEVRPYVCARIADLAAYALAVDSPHDDP